MLNLHLRTTLDDTFREQANMTMMYKINSGPVQEIRYGLHLARAIGLPQRFLDVAEEVSAQLEAEFERKKRSCEANRLFKRRRLILNLHETLFQLRTAEMDENALRSYLQGLQEAFIQRMEAIETNTSVNDIENEEVAGGESVYDA